MLCDKGAIQEQGPQRSNSSGKVTTSQCFEYILRKEFVQKCDKCWRFSFILHKPPIKLTTVTTLWSFSKLGVDIVGALPTSQRQVQFAIMAINYFIKWMKAKPLATIIEAKTISFIKKNIICRFGTPYTIVTDNRKQFHNAKFREFYDNLETKSIFSSLAYSQANEQVEATNKIIKSNLKVKWEKLKSVWANELPYVLQAYKTIIRTYIKETFFPHL